MASSYAYDTSEQLQAPHARPSTPTVLLKISERSSTSDWVYGVLHRAIVNLQMEPGERLSRRYISKWLGVSATPLRDALQMLQLQGLVDIRAQAETRVGLIDEVGLHSMHFERVALESEVIRRVVRRQSRAVVATLRRAVEASERLDVQFEKTNDEKNLASGFHADLFRAVGLEEMFERLEHNYGLMVRCKNIDPAPDSGKVASTTFQRQILSRIEAEDAQGAVSALKALLSDDIAAIGRAKAARPEWFG